VTLDWKNWLVKQKFVVMNIGLQVLYNIRPQAVTAADLEGTAYDSGLRSSRVARRPKTLRSSSFVRRHWWTLTLGLLASTAFLLLRRHRHALLV